MNRSAVLGAGHYVAPLVERLGVRRPIEPEPVGTSELGARASRAALANAGMQVDDVDFIIFATINPDVTFPGAACYLQPKLGCGTIGALDLRGQCAGFLFGMAVADQFVRCGVYQRVLVVGAELHSVWVDYSPEGAEVARLFGDGAGAVVIGPHPDRGLLSMVMGTDGSRHDRFWCEYPSSRQHPVRVTPENLRARLHFPTIDTAEVRRFGSSILPQVIQDAVRQASLDPRQVDRFIVGHVFPDVATAALKELGVGEERLVNPSERYGHLGGAAVPVALSEELMAGRIAPGAVVCLAAAGAGLTWAAAVLRI